MKILYRQSTNSDKEVSVLARHGVNNCYFKSIKQTSGEGIGTKKRHSHTGFEFHIMIDGKQCYETESGVFMLEGGNVFAVPKGVRHSLSSCDHPVKKYAFTFALDKGAFELEGLSKCVLFPISERVLSNIRTVETLDKDSDFKAVLIENIVFETVCLLLNELGVRSVSQVACEEDPYLNKDKDERVELAIQFIKDNIESPLQVGEVASYCYISEKQLNRLFLKDTDTTVAAYIRRERMKRIEELLSTADLSLSEISERFNFPTEHGFNLFFKKNNGMPPGEYRKMTKNGKD